MKREPPSPLVTLTSSDAKFKAWNARCDRSHDWAFASIVPRNRKRCWDARRQCWTGGAS